MKKLFKVLNKHNKHYLIKQKANKKSLKLYKTSFEKQGLFFKVNDDFDYLRFSIIRTSYDNMTTIQSSFFEIKESLRELWDVITYQEKHFLVYQELNPVLDTLKSFEIDEKRHFITYVDSLINAYYDHDMLMFENPSYQKYLYDYSTLVNDGCRYGIAPIQNGFAQVDFIVGEDENYVMYNREMKRFYHIQGSHQQSVGVVKELEDYQIEKIAILIKNGEFEQLVSTLLAEDIVNNKIKKKLEKMKRKF